MTERFAGGDLTAFERVNEWVFDLDNTLYPADSNLFAQVDQRMGGFIAEFLGVPFEQARRVQKDYYYRYGTTLSGLMHEHKVPPEAFMDYVHDIDLSPISAAPELAAAIEALPGRKFIFTNGSVAHATRVCDKLGLTHLFDGVFDIQASGYVPKPKLECYNAFLEAHGVHPRQAAMFEDLPHNLEAPHALGMATVLVRSSFHDHPSQRAIDAWDFLPAHIHHYTEDLAAFVSAVNAHLASRS
ncbi:MAG: pyrimidine 5'-nucleotidase [Hyphomicrobiales bacterium]|nr:pyrimidine 5'-nucleotidase [Hyphomicrobiales bacterium]